MHWTFPDIFTFPATWYGWVVLDCRLQASLIQDNWMDPLSNNLSIVSSLKPHLRRLLISNILWIEGPGVGREANEEQAEDSAGTSP